MDSQESLDRLRETVVTFAALEESAFASAGQAHRRALSELHRVCALLIDCERAGAAREEIVEVLAPMREIHARSPFVSRLQQWPRGYAGDFETVEYICRGADGVLDQALPRQCETYSLNFPIAQQHRNKVHHQAAQILRAAMARDNARILILACGGCPDLRMLAPLLHRTGATVVLNDSDPAALEFAASHLGELAEQSRFLQGQALRVAKRLTGGEAFDLVLAGGLFDYLPDRHATYLIDTVYSGLLREGGRFFFTNIAEENPYRVLIEYVGNWFLIERSAADVRRLCDGANVNPDCVRIRRDESGLTYLVEVTRESYTTACADGAA